VASTTPPSPEAIRTIDSQALLGSQGVIYIRHQGERYRLQTTRFGKLILTK
jgi:hemin uptake protein HemP